MCGELSVRVEKYLSTHTQGTVITNGFPHLGPKDPGDPREHLKDFIFGNVVSYF